MTTEVYNQAGEILEKINLPKEIFGVAFNNDLVYQVYTSLLSNQRKPLAFTKDRSEVRGGGKKPWAQKGTGRARHGSIRSPIWKGGGVAFGPRLKNENLKKKINKKMKQLGAKMVLSRKLEDNEIRIIDQFNIPEIKTKKFYDILKQILKKDVSKKILILLDKNEQPLKRGLKNISSVTLGNITDINILQLMNHRFVMFSKEALKNLEKQLA